MEAQSFFNEINQFAEEVSELLYNWGFKRVHGRIWTHLYLSERALDASDLVKRLDISKALISISLRELLDFEIITEIGKSPKGTNLYQTNPNLTQVFVHIMKKREQALLARLQLAQEKLCQMSEEAYKATETNPDKVLGLKSLLNHAEDILEGLLNLPIPTPVQSPTTKHEIHHTEISTDSASLS